MNITTFLIIICLLYGALLFFDTFFKTCAHYPYIQFLRGTGIEVKPFQLRWQTTAFNRVLVRWGSSNTTKFFNFWFDCGMYVTLILFPLSICMLLFSTYQIFWQNTSHRDTTLVLEPVLPGINLPASEIGFYSITLIICSALHELGHALVAVKEDVHLINVGVNVFFVIPVAYVNISGDKLRTLNPWRTLRIMTAGVWHNLVLSAVAYLLFCTVPYVFSTTYFINNGVSVTAIDETSPLLGVRGLELGDTITQINDCSVKNDESWESCLSAARVHKPGFCIDADVAHVLDETVPLKQSANGILDCCAHDKQNYLCFEYVETVDGVVELPPHMCLPARKIMEQSVQFCNGSLQKCPNSYHCIRPLLQNVTSLLMMKRLQNSDVIYIGHPSDIYLTIQVSSFVPKYLFSTSFLPDLISKFFKYIVVFSTGLAIVNVIPCLFMDGQHITNSLVQIISRNKFESRQTISLISAFITLNGTFILFVNFLHSIWRYIRF